MKMILQLGLAGLLAVALTGCATTGGKASSGLTPTVSGSISTGVSSHF